MLKKVLSHTFIYALGPQLPRVVSILLMPLITPFLTKEDYGIHGIIIAYLAAFSALKDLGLVTVLSNTFYKDRNDYHIIWGRLFGFLSCWGFILGPLLLLVLWAVIPPEADTNFWLIGTLYCLPVMFFDTTILFGSRHFHLLQKPTSFVIISIFGSLITIGVTYFSIVELKLGYLGWFYAVLLKGFLLF